MINLKQKKHAFTLAEVIIVCSLFAVMVIWIIFAINRSFVYLDNTRLSVRATNLAREWVEMVYNRRDSNRRKCSGNKDKTWLYVWGSKECSDISSADMLRPWTYTIKEWEANWDKFIYLEGLDPISDPTVDPYEIEGFFSSAYSTQREASEIIFTGNYSYYSWWALHTWWKVSDLLAVSWLKFYRIVRVYGVYKKNVDSPDSWIGGPSYNYSAKSWEPEEMRFCVKVFYTASLWWQHAVELCSIMTNFQE